MTVWEKSGRQDARSSQSREQLYFPAPYAVTPRISMYSADCDPDAIHNQQQQPQQQENSRTWRPEEREHTYDVPFVHRHVTRI
ncbi:hypothetical protein X975_11775, partial [Stegodyphus mimosarum]